jgi:hypothetical protein
MALYIVREIDNNGFPFEEDEIYFDDSEYGGNAEPAAQEAFDWLVPLTSHTVQLLKIAPQAS